MTAQTLCPQHSGLKKAIDTLEHSDSAQWEVIKKIQNRPPVWTMAVISLLTFLLGICVAGLR